MSTYREPTRQGPIIIISLVVFLAFAIGLAAYFYGVAHVVFFHPVGLTLAAQIARLPLNLKPLTCEATFNALPGYAIAEPRFAG